MNILTIWKGWWHLHGTKIIGFTSAAIATLEFVDQATINVIENTLGPKWGPVVAHCILIGAGLMTARRGFRNSAKAAAQ